MNNIQWVLIIIAGIVWVYFLIKLIQFLLYKFSIKYFPVDPEKKSFKWPFLAILAAGLLFSTYLKIPELFSGNFDLLLISIFPLLFIDGIMPFFIKKRIYFSKYLIVRHEDYTRWLSWKKVARINLKKDKFELVDHDSFTPILTFSKVNYSKNDWFKFREYLLKNHKRKVVVFY